MPVQFTCSRCHRRLSVAHRKAGTTVACPKCGSPNVVPGSAINQAESQAAPAAPATDEVATAAAPEAALPALPESPVDPPEKGDFQELISTAFDDVQHLITEQETGGAAEAAMAPPPIAPPVMTPVTPPAAAPVEAALSAPVAPPPIPPATAATIEPRLPSVSSTASRRPAARRGRHDDGVVLLLSRQAVYAQAALAGGLALLAFLAGLTMGRASRPVQKSESGSPAASEPVPLEGYVLYSPSSGNTMPDAGAIIIALPAGKAPAEKIAASGLRPGDGDDLSAVPAVDELRAIGGAIARADQRGQYQLVVPRPGDFSILIVSRRAKRGSERTIAMADQQALARVFASPSDLIGQQRYAIISRRLAGAPPPYNHEFGPTDKS